MCAAKNSKFVYRRRIFSKHNGDRPYSRWTPAGTIAIASWYMIFLVAWCELHHRNVLNPSVCDITIRRCKMHLP